MHGFRSPQIRPEVAEMNSSGTTMYISAILLLSAFAVMRNLRYVGFFVKKVYLLCIGRVMQGGVWQLGILGRVIHL